MLGMAYQFAVSYAQNWTQFSLKKKVQWCSLQSSFFQLIFLVLPNLNQHWNHCRITAIPALFELGLLEACTFANTKRKTFLFCQNINTVIRSPVRGKAPKTILNYAESTVICCFACVELPAKDKTVQFVFHKGSRNYSPKGIILIFSCAKKQWHFAFP